MRKEKRNRFGIGVLQKIPDETGEVLCRREQTSLSAGDFSGARRRETPVPSGVFGKKAAETALRFHKSLPEYRETPLISLSHLSGELGVGGIYVKDESWRFGLNAFKGLGGAYAMFRILCRRLGLDPEKTDFGTFQEAEIRERVSQITFATATDGNHGKGVSWAAKLFGCSARVFMPKGSSPARAQAIRKAGPAEVEITDENYDGAVKMARKKSEEQGWILIQDTSWKGYEEIPLRIIQGYLTMASEAAGQLKSEKKAPTHVFLQAGVGAMAGGVMAYLAEEYRESPPVFCVVEPETANSVFLSAERADGEICSVEGNPDTIMVGLNCGTPCGVTWPILRDLPAFYFSCPDFVSAHGMRLYAHPQKGDPKIISGESGAVTAGLTDLLLREKELIEIRKRLHLNENSVVLLFNTEGDTDPENYRSVVQEGAFPLPETPRGI